MLYQPVTMALKTPHTAWSCSQEGAGEPVESHEASDTAQFLFGTPKGGAARDGSIPGLTGVYPGHASHPVVQVFVCVLGFKDASTTWAILSLSAIQAAATQSRGAGTPDDKCGFHSY